MFLIDFNCIPSPDLWFLKIFLWFGMVYQWFHNVFDRFESSALAKSSICLWFFPIVFIEFRSGFATSFIDFNCLPSPDLWLSHGCPMVLYAFPIGKCCTVKCGRSNMSLCTDNRFRVEENSTSRIFVTQYVPREVARAPARPRARTCARDRGPPSPSSLHPSRPHRLFGIGCVSKITLYKLLLHPLLPHYAIKLKKKQYTKHTKYK